MNQLIKKEEDKVVFLDCDNRTNLVPTSILTLIKLGFLRVVFSGGGGGGGQFDSPPSYFKKN